MKRFLLSICILMLSASAMAQKKYDDITYPKLNEFTKSDVETITLDNGITFFLLEDKELPLIRVNVTSAFVSYVLSKIICNVLNHSEEVMFQVFS